MSTYKTRGETIRDLRKKAGMTQEDLAKALDTTKQTIYKYEAGIVTNIPPDKVEAMARIFHVPPAILMGWDPFEADDFADLISAGKSVDEAFLRVKCGEIYYGKKVMALNYSGREIVEALIDKLLRDQGIDPEWMKYDDILESIEK